ncbi:MAG TPA: hypothetical protein VND45_12315 [Thermoanaerobaculia bacterium]|nr:hypothetical protein [Thermoanaerobaculia bacterium]
MAEDKRRVTPPRSPAARSADAAAPPLPYRRNSARHQCGPQRLGTRELHFARDLAIVAVVEPEQQRTEGHPLRDVHGDVAAAVARV